MPLLTSLLLLILVSRFLSGLMVRLGQPGLIGEMLTGILLGPALLGLIQPTHELKGISELAVFLIVMSAGMEMDFKKVIGSFTGKGLLIGATGFFIPLACGMLVGLCFKMDLMRLVFLGLCVSITAMPVAVRILESFGALDSIIARYSITTGILNDLAALLALGVILDLPDQKDLLSIGLSVGFGVGKLIGFALLILGIDWIFNHLKKWGVNVPDAIDQILKWAGPDALFGFSVIFVLIFSSISENLGFHAVIGAFFGALLLSREMFGIKNFLKLDHALGSIANGFLAPIFFTFLGLEFSNKAFQMPWFLTVVIVVSILSKFGAGYLGAKLCGFSQKDRVGIGIILNGRGIMELVVANIALEKGFIGPGLFSVLVLMGIVTTLITPVLFRFFVMKPAAGDIKPIPAGLKAEIES
jgi:Kef-type K+ transport system membrane component KefB